VKDLTKFLLKNSGKFSLPKLFSHEPGPASQGSELSKVVLGEGFSMKDVELPVQKKPEFKELKSMGKPLLKIDYDPKTKEMSKALSVKSKTFVNLEKEVEQVLDKRVDKVINKALDLHKKKFGDGYYDAQFSVGKMAKVMLSNQKTLSIMLGPGQKPHYDPDSNKVVVNDVKWLDSLPHEMEHARQQLSGDLSLKNPGHRLWSEKLAFGVQDAVSKELSGKSPDVFEGRTPEQMAKSYIGKKGYPGTVESSKKMVDDDALSKHKKKD
jgi:hypothetical protein